MKTIRCPLMNGEIEDVVCFDINMVAEGMAPEHTAPEDATKKTNYKEICLNCPNHRED